ncbi:MAG: aldehyde dehydrogenase family protein [Hyphomonas sp.]|uniref:aldehyde dehydrogenase family protein n=1 Tax=Hyphomonas sp. TaxID=87 RepID=UPI0032678B9C
MNLKLEDRLFINGEYLPSGSAGREAIINPATEEVLGEVCVGGAEELDAALDAARDSFSAGVWRKLPLRSRIETMKRFYDALERRRENIVALLVAEVGSTVGLANFGQYGLPMKHFRYYLEAASRDFTWMSTPELTPSADGRTVLGTSIVKYDPVGVVAAITPYNYPFMLNIVKIVPALLMGNSLVLKPSPYTPFSALFLGEIAREAGLPPGILNIVTGGLDVSRDLTRDPRVDLITFTGSDQVGATIMAQAAPTLKRVVMELGGKSAFIVRADADINRAAAIGVGSFTGHCGQGCAILTRHIVHNSVRKAYVARVKELVEAIMIGDPSDPKTMMGPLIRESQRQRVESYFDLGRASGARLVTGGGRPKGLERGFFVQPTVFDNVDNRSRLAQEEVFGPIAAVIGFDDDDEALDLANDSQFGLAGAVISADAGKAYEMSLEMRTGGVAINGGAGTMLSDAPFGGISRSGFGRENGVEGLKEFTYAKSILIHAG